MSRANEIAAAYAKGLADAVRKKNTKSLFGAKGEAEMAPEGMGEAELDDGTIEEILAAQSEGEVSGESPMPDDMPPEAVDPDDEMQPKKPIR